MDCLNRRYHMKVFKDCFIHFTCSILGYFDPYYMHILYKQYTEDKALFLIEGEAAQILKNSKIAFSKIVKHLI